MREVIIPREREAGDEALAAIRECLSRVRFGTIALTIHDGKVVQLDVTEKKRLAS